MSRIVVLKLPGEKLSGIAPVEKKPRARPKSKRTPKAKEKTEEEGGPSRPIPKASLGAVIASLRALDTSGNQCRKWTQKKVKIKAFTGYTVELPSWVGGRESETIFHDKKEAKEGKDVKEAKEPKSDDIY